MQYQVLAVGLNDDTLSCYREYFLTKNIELKKATNISETVRILEKETVQLLILNMEYLRGIGQSEWIINIRHVSFIPIIVLSDFPAADIGPVIQAGADICYDNKLPPSVIALLLLAQLRRRIEYDHFHEPEIAPFQIGDIAIDPSRRLVWVRGQQAALLPREFSLLLYFMQNPNIVLTQEQICANAWKRDCLQSISGPIYNLRQKIEPDPAHPIYIKTVYRVGYRFTGYSDEICDN